MLPSLGGTWGHWDTQHREASNKLDKMGSGHISAPPVQSKHQESGTKINPLSDKTMRMISTADLERNFEARAMIGNIPHFNLYKNVP